MQTQGGGESKNQGKRGHRLCTTPMYTTVEKSINNHNLQFKILSEGDTTIENRVPLFPRVISPSILSLLTLITCEFIFEGLSVGLFSKTTANIDNMSFSGTVVLLSECPTLFRYFNYTRSCLTFILPNLFKRLNILPPGYISKCLRYDHSNCFDCSCFFPFRFTHLAMLKYLFDTNCTNEKYFPYNSKFSLSRYII